MKLKTALLITSGILAGLTTLASACGGDPNPSTPPSTSNCTQSGTTSTYAFAPIDRYGYGDQNVNDLRDLPHGNYFTWGIHWDIPTNETITGATLTFNNIRNWDGTSNTLFVNLLNNSSSKIIEDRVVMGSEASNDPTQSDYFDAHGTTAAPYEHVDIFDYHLGTVGTNISYSFSGDTLAKLQQYLVDGIFGLGFDPDCHFYNDGIELKIATLCNTPGGNPVPEPATMFLFGTGLVGLAGSRSRKKSK